MATTMLDRTDGATILDRLATAHGTLALLPVRDWPRGYVLNCGGVGEAEERPGADRPARERLLAPSRAAIAKMEEALGWLSLLPAPPSPVRKAVQFRILTSPRTGRPQLTWPEIGQRLGCSHTHARTLTMEGVEIIAAGLRPFRQESSMNESNGDITPASEPCWNCESIPGETYLRRWLDGRGEALAPGIA